MSYTKDSPQHRRIARIPSGGTVHNSTSAVTVSSQGAHASISSLPKTLGGVGLDYRTKDVQSLENGLYRWQVSGAGSSKWPNNSSDSSVPYGSPALETISAAYSEILDSSIRSADGGQAQRFFGGKGQFSTAVASVLSGGSPEFGFNASPSVGAAALASNASSLSFQGWNSTRDRSNLSLAVDPSKGGFALQGAAAATGRSPTTSAAQTTARFSTNPRFAERAARFSALANGSYSLSSFPLTETENGGRSPAENDCTGGSGREAAVPSSGGGPPRRSDLGQDCSSRIPVATYHNVSEDRRAVSDGGKENLERREETKAVAATTGRTRSDWDGTDQRGGRNAEEQERFLSDSEESESSRGEQQEASRGDELSAACLDRSAALVRKKRNFFSSEQQHGKESSNGVKERKVGLDGPSKRCKDGKRGAEKDELKEKAEWSSSSRGHSSPSSPAAASKDVARNVEQQPKLDYIHVRARRGQATDSHSLAERVRREKISERMKYLQDLVPGCSKVTGKAGMLDEIINYVQSIQRQVEFLSMKLAAVTPRPDFNPDSILSKQLQMGSAYGHSVVEHSENNLPLTQAETQQALHVPQEGATTPDFQPAVDISVRRMNEARVLLPKNPLPVFHTGGPFQASSRWDGDLQSVVQMGLSQGNHGYRQTGYHSFSPGSMILE